MSTLFALLKSKKFLPLFIAQFFSAFNNNVFKNAFLIWFTYDIAVKTGANAGVMNSLAALFFILPFFLFSCFAGQIADKFEKSALIRKIKFAEIILMSFCFVGFYFQNQYFLLALLFLIGAESALFGPLKYSLPKQLLPEKELVNANALIETSTFLAILFGTIFGASFIRTKFGTEIICITLLTLAISGFIATLFISKTEIGDKNLKINYNIFSEIFSAIKFAKKDKNLFKIMIMISWFWLIGTVFLTQFPSYSKNILNADESLVSLFLIIFSIGIGLGSIFYIKLAESKINLKLIKIAIFGISASITLFCILSMLYQGVEGANLIQFLKNWHAYPIIFSLLLLAIFCGLYIVPLYSALQILTQKQFIARIIAINNVFNAFFMVLASVLMIILLKSGLDIVEIFLIIAGLNLIMGYILPRNKF